MDRRMLEKAGFQPLQGKALAHDAIDVRFASQA